MDPVSLVRRLWRTGAPFLALLVAASSGGCGSSPVAPPPVLTLSCPPGVLLQAAAGESSVTATFPDPVPGGGKPPITVHCSPQSGSAFAVGSTDVSCSASDPAQQTASCVFTVAVQPPVPQISLTNFMAFGDSMTEGKVTLAGVPSVTFPPSYTLKLAAMLQSRYSAQSIVVVNEGRGGQDAAQDIDRFDIALDADKPQAVLLLEGANDIHDFGDAGVDPAISALGTMASHATTRGVLVFLATEPPANPAGPNGGGAPFVSSLDAKIVNLAASRQLTLVDVNAAFHGDLSLIGPDGLHPTDAGYQVIAQTFYDQIVARLEVPATFGALRIR